MAPEELEEALAGDDNYPAPGLGQGAGGSRPHVTDEVARERRMALAGLLASGVDRDAQYRLMASKFGMSASAVDRLRQEVYQGWQQVDAEEQQHAKAAWMRRNLRYSQRAAADGQFSAAAKIEDTISKVLGLQTLHVQGESVVHHVHAVAGETLKSVIAAYSEEQLEEFAQQERLLQAKPQAQDAEFIDVAALDQVEAELERATEPAVPRPRRKRSQVAAP